MPAALPLSAVNHLGLRSRRVEESRRFWRDVVGFREVSRPGFNFPGAWLYNHGLMIHLIYHELQPDPHPEIGTRENHIALHSDDLAQVERLLIEHGVKYRKTEIADRGIQQIFFQDPDGHHIEIGKYPATPPFVD